MTTLHSFDFTDGESLRRWCKPPTGTFTGRPRTGGTGNCYGLGCGKVFKMTPPGMLTVLHSFGGTDGDLPEGTLLQSTKGSFYGTTLQGGTDTVDCALGCGTVFSLSVGLGPIVSFVQSSGKVGWKAEILGQGFTGTSSVSFNGTAAAGFTVKNDTYLTATVPAGATTGSVMVTTPSDTLTSNVPFRVRPQILSSTSTSGPIGMQVTITGVSLTQTTKVAFNGTPTTNFTLDSDTQVTATVPQGARGHGPIAITTAGGKTWSAQNFTVTQ